MSVKGPQVWQQKHCGGGGESFCPFKIILISHLEFHWKIFTSGLYKYSLVRTEVFLAAKESTYFSQYWKLLSEILDKWTLLYFHVVFFYYSQVVHNPPSFMFSPPKLIQNVFLNYFATCGIPVSNLWYTLLYQISIHIQDTNLPIRLLLTYKSVPCTTLYRFVCKFKM